MSFWQYLLNPEFIAFVFLGAVTGFFVGAIPGLSVTMATALLVSVTYSWETGHALAMIMGVYVVGVYSGALSAILLNIPGTPASVVTTFDGHPLAKKGKALLALRFAGVYSFVGSVFGFIALWLLAKPISKIALQFTPMDYFLLAALGLLTAGVMSGKSYAKGLISVAAGLFLAMIGLDPVVGRPRFTFGILELQAGVSIVPVLIGLFGMAEVFHRISQGSQESQLLKIKKDAIHWREVWKHFGHSLYYSIIGTGIGALPGAGGPVASFLAYSQAKKIEKNLKTPLGEGAVEGIVASESANNAVIGGALIPLLTLAIPGDAVTAIILSVFYIHGLQPGPLFLQSSPDMYLAILAGGLLACVFLLVLSVFVSPYVTKILTFSGRALLPIVMVFCVIGSYAASRRLFDVILMLVFGIIGYWMKRNDYSIAGMTLALVLGGVMDSNFRRAVSLALPEENMLLALFGRPITLVLTIMIVFTIAMAIRKKHSDKKGMSQNKKGETEEKAKKS